MVLNYAHKLQKNMTTIWTKKFFFYILKSKANNSDIYFFSQGDPNDPGYKQLN